jgi:hypothetical protein
LTWAWFLKIILFLHWLDLVAKGEVPMSRIDDAVSRILKWSLIYFKTTSLI